MQLKGESKTNSAALEVPFRPSWCVGGRLLKTDGQICGSRSMQALATLLVVLAVGHASHAGPDREARDRALKALCPIALKAGGIWGDDNINGAIATIDSGANWPDGAQETAYQVCNYGGYLR